jgi:hypothetical protein
MADGYEVVLHLACIETRAERLDEAFEHLARAVSLDPRAAEAAKKDSDLAPLRDDPRFASTLAGKTDTGGLSA